MRQLCKLFIFLTFLYYHSYGKNFGAVPLIGFFLIYLNVANNLCILL